MSACREVNTWITKEVQVPVEEKITETRQECEKVKKRIEERIHKPVERWVTRQERRCKRKKCKWWCGCCNKWFCWIATFVVKVVTWVVVTVVKWVTYWTCKIVTFVVDIIVKIVIRLVKFLVTFVVCLVTLDFKGVWRSIVDLWTDLVGITEDIVLFFKSLISDLENLVVEIERLTDSIACSFGTFGTFFIATPGRFTVRIAREAGDLAYDLIDNVWDIVAGILRLNWCQFVAGWAGVGADVGKAVALVLGIPFGLGGAARDAFKQRDLQKTVEAAIDGVTEDEDRREAMRDKVGLGGCPFGLRFELLPYRFYLDSTAEEPDLRALHREGVINLYGAGGFTSDCDGAVINRPRWEVVYAGTRSRVSYSDLKQYLDGPDSNDVAAFRVYAIAERVFERDLALAQRKAYSIGVELHWESILEHRISTRSPELIVPDTDPTIGQLFEKLGRVGGGDDDLCVIPAPAIFRYVTEKRSGYAGVYRPPTDTGASGASFRDRLPEFVFRWMLIHELGHYFGLEHRGHDGIHHIMFTADPGQGLDKWTSETTAELFLSGLEPQFSRDDQFRVWNWITSTAIECLDDIIDHETVDQTVG